MSSNDEFHYSKQMGDGGRKNLSVFQGLVTTPYQMTTCAYATVCIFLGRLFTASMGLSDPREVEIRSWGYPPKLAMSFLRTRNLQL